MANYKPTRYQDEPILFDLLNAEDKQQVQEQLHTPKTRELSKKRERKRRRAENAQTVLSLRAEGHTLKQIEAKTGLSYGAIRTTLTRAGMESRSNLRERNDKICEMKRQGMNNEELGQHFGLSETYVSWIASKSRVPREDQT